MIGKGYWRIAGVLVVVVTAFLVRERAHAQQKVSHDFLVTRVRVFDGARTLQNTQVAVTGGIIRAVGGDLASWRHLPAIDGSGSTLVPGLIDAHAHVADTGDLRQALRFGVTTVLDMGATTQLESVLFAMRSEANLATDIADLRSAGDPAAAPGSHEELGADKPSISTVEEATRFVADRRAADPHTVVPRARGTASLAMEEEHDAGCCGRDAPESRAAPGPSSREVTVELRANGSRKRVISED